MAAGTGGAPGLHQFDNTRLNLYKLLGRIVSMTTSRAATTRKQLLSPVSQLKTGPQGEELAACTGHFSPLLPSEGQVLRVPPGVDVPDRHPAELRQDRK